jgi:hypothetical protein
LNSVKVEIREKEWAFTHPVIIGFEANNVTSLGQQWTGRDDLLASHSNSLLQSKDLWRASDFKPLLTSVSGEFHPDRQKHVRKKEKEKPQLGLRDRNR